MPNKKIKKRSGASVRKKLYPGEDSYFKKNPNVTGMAAEDNRVIINPYSKLSSKEKKSVIVNESTRIGMRKRNITPNIKVTKEQRKYYKGTAYQDKDLEMKRTIISRIASGDPSAKATKSQIKEAKKILRGLK